MNDVVKYLRDSGQIDGDVLEYIETLEKTIDNQEDIISQLDRRIGRGLALVGDAKGILEGNL